MAGAGNPEVSEVARKPVIQLLNQGFSALPLSSGVGCPARMPSPEDSWSGSASSWVSRVGRSVSYGKQRATQVELSSSEWPSAGPLLRAVGPDHSGFRADRRAVSPASPICWAERRGIFLGNFQVRALIFLLVYYLGGQGGDVIVFYQGASKLLF